MIVLFLLIAQLPGELINDLDGDVPLNGGDSEKQTTQQHPADLLAVVAQVEGGVLESAALAEGEHQPEENIQKPEELDQVADLLELRLVLEPVNFAQNMEGVDVYPDEQIPNGGQHEEFLEEQVVKSEEASLHHAEHVNALILAGYWVVGLLRECLVSPQEKQKSSQADDALAQSKEASEAILGAVQDG